jgi:flagellar biogenesis protein FliO
MNLTGVFMFNLILAVLVFIFPSLFSQESNDNNLPNIEVQNLPEPQFQYAFLRMILVLVAVIFLFVITLWFFRKLMRVKESQANSLKTIKILEKRALSPKSMLYLVEVEGEKVLIAESHLEIKRIHNLNSKEQV